MDNNVQPGRNPYAEEQNRKNPSWGRPVIYASGFVMAIVIVFTLFGPAEEQLGIPSVLAILLYWVLMVLFFLFAIVLHSVGKLVMGLLSGYKLLVFTAGPICVVRERGRFVRKKLPPVFSLGHCFMAPPRADSPEQAKYFWYCFGGAFFEIIFAALSLAAVILSGDPVVKWVMSAGVFAFGMIAMVYLLPTSKGVPNDGMLIARFKSDPQARLINNHILVMSELELEGVSVFDIPDEIFDGGDINGGSPYCDIAALKACNLVSRGELETAREMLEQLINNPSIEANGVLRMGMRSALAYCLLMLGGEIGRVHELMDERTMMSARNMGRYSLTSLRCIYAYMLKAQNDPAGAEQLYIHASGMKESCLSLTEYEQEMRIMSRIRAEAAK